MTYEQFLLIISNNFLFIFLISFLSVLFTLLIYRKYIISLFDPLMFHAILSGAGYSVVFILYYLKLISDFYFIHFLVTQIAFFLGFTSFKPLRIQGFCNFYCVKSTPISFSLRLKILYYISGFIYIIDHLFLYVFSGVPLFMFSRHEAYIGFGVIKRFDIVTSLILVTILSFKFLSRIKISKIDLIFFLSFLICSLLSGSKGALLKIVFVSFYVSLFGIIKFEDYLFLQRWKFFAFFSFFISLLFCLFVILIRVDANPFSHLFFRIIMTGDVYMMAYVNDVIREVNGSFFWALFGPTLAGFKVIPWSMVPHNLGQQLANYIYNLDEPFGPNARHNVFGLAYLGPYFSVLFSFLLGCLVSFIRNKLVFLFRKNLEGMLLFVLFVMPVFSFESDIVYALYQYSSIFSSFLMIYFLSVVVAEVLKIKLGCFKFRYE